MNLYWIYDYPTWLLFVGLIIFFVVLSVTGILTLRYWTDDVLKVTTEDNATISEYMGVTGVFFGLVLGMVAVGSWESYQQANETAIHEASQIDVFYSTIALMPIERSPALKAAIQEFVQTIINQDWPKQRQGILPDDSENDVRKIGKLLFKLPVETPKDEILLGAAVEHYYGMVQARRERLQSVASSKLPGSLWWVVVASTGIIICLSMLMKIDNLRLDIMINLLMSILTGSILGFIIAMDNPYRGEISVSPQPYQQILEDMLQDQVI